MVCTMNKKTLILLFTLILSLVVPALPVRADTGAVDSVSAFYLGGQVMVDGRVNGLAGGRVALELMTSTGGLLYFSAPGVAGDGTFGETIVTGTLPSGTYTVRAANAEGGPYTTTTFRVASSGSGSTAPPPPPPPPPPPTLPFGNLFFQLELSGNLSGGTLIAPVPPQGIETALGASPGGIALLVNGPANTPVQVQVTGGSMDQIAASGTGALTISSPPVQVSLDSGVIGQMAGMEGDFSLHMAPFNPPSGFPGVQLNITMGGNPVSSFDGTITAAMPFTPPVNIDFGNPEGWVVRRQDENSTRPGDFIEPEAFVWPETSQMVWRTNHFSTFYIDYNPVEFTDVPRLAWFGQAVRFVGAREIASGTGNGEFSPHMKVTRAQFLVMAMKALGLEPDTDPVENFSDAGSTWYTGYLAAAREQGLTSGVGQNLFAPDRKITRQEMMVLLYNILNSRNRLPEADGKGADAFGDAGDVSPWAQEAMDRMVGAGILAGSGGKLLPLETASRAQLAQILYNLIVR